MDTQTHAKKRSRWEMLPADTKSQETITSKEYNPVSLTLPTTNTTSQSEFLSNNNSISTKTNKPIQHQLLQSCVYLPTGLSNCLVPNVHEIITGPNNSFLSFIESQTHCKVKLNGPDMNDYFVIYYTSEQDKLMCISQLNNLLSTVYAKLNLVFVPQVFSLAKPLIQRTTPVQPVPMLPVLTPSQPFIPPCPIPLSPFIPPGIAPPFIPPPFLPPFVPQPQFMSPLSLNTHSKIDTQAEYNTVPLATTKQKYGEKNKEKIQKLTENKRHYTESQDIKEEKPTIIEVQDDFFSLNNVEDPSNNISKNISSSVSNQSQDNQKLNIEENTLTSNIPSITTIHINPFKDASLFEDIYGAPTDNIPTNTIPIKEDSNQDKHISWIQSTNQIDNTILNTRDNDLQQDKQIEFENTSIKFNKTSNTNKQIQPLFASLSKTRNDILHTIPENLKSEKNLPSSYSKTSPISLKDIYLSKNNESPLSEDNLPNKRNYPSDSNSPSKENMITDTQRSENQSPHKDKFSSRYDDSDDDDNNNENEYTYKRKNKSKSRSESSVSSTHINNSKNTILNTASPTTQSTLMNTNNKTNNVLLTYIHSYDSDSSS